MMMPTFDTEKFIREVEKRPPLWDTCSEHYTNTEARKIMWEELADIFRPFSLKPQDTEELCYGLHKKWKNIRDCFTRELRRLKLEKNCLPAKRKNPYIYFDQLKFLISTVSPSELSVLDVEPNHSSLKSHSTEDIDESPRKKKRDEDSVDKQLLELLGHSLKKKEEVDNQETDDDRLFLLSLLHDLKQVPEDLKMRTKIELMIVLDKAKRGGSGFSYAE